MIKKDRKSFGEWIDPQVKWLFNVPMLLALGLTLFYPIAYGFALSFSKWFMVANPSPQWFTFSNYIKLFADTRFVAATLRSVYFMLTAVGIEFILGLAIALLLNCKHRGRKVYRILLLIPMMSVPMVVAIMWRTMFNYTFGVINYVIDLLGFSKVEFLGNAKIVLFSIVLVDVWQWTAFITMIVLAGLYALPISPMEAARIDGATRWQRFIHVTLPLIQGHMAAAVILRSIGAFKTFEIIWGMTEAGPNFASETLYPFTYAQAFRYYYLGYASAAGVLFFLVILGINVVFIYLRRSR